MYGTTALDPVIKAFDDHWHDLRGDRDIPLFADFRISKVPRKSIPYLCFLDVEYNPRRYKYRLIGTSIQAAYGADLKGKYIEDMEVVTEGKLAEFTGDLNLTVDQRTIARRIDSYELPDGSRYSFEGAIYPFMDKDSMVTHVISVVANLRNGVRY